MVGCNMLQTHKRLQQLKGTGDDYVFGNISILSVGDLYQLQPVAQPYIFDQLGDAYASLHRSGSVWINEITMLELDEIMQQRCSSSVQAEHQHAQSASTMRATSSYQGH